MDASRFDALARALAATPTRRAALGGLLGAVLAGLGLAPAAAQRAAACFPAGARCRKPGQCCSKKCRNGECAGGCPPGKKACGRACVNPKSDPRHCGRCDRRCPAGTRCCTGACVDPQTDRRHCGGCGRRCVAGQACDGGACECGGERCRGCCADGACLRVGAQDETQCGRNGVACAPCGTCQVCRGGSCAQAEDGTTCAGGLCCGGSCRVGVECCDATDCDPGQVCLANGSCATPCDNSAQCQPNCSGCTFTTEGQGYCSTGVLIECDCASTAGCPPGSVCNPDGCLSVPPIPGCNQLCHP